MSSFRFAHAGGADWREALNRALADLGDAGRALPLGLCYLTDSAGGEAAAVLECLRQGSAVSHWAGTVGAGVCSDGVEYFGTPAAALLTLDLRPSDFRLFRSRKQDLSDLDAGLEDWIEAAGPRFGIVHGDPRHPGIEAMIAALSARLGGGYLVGGLSCAREAHFQLADAVVAGGLSGVLFGGNVAVATRLSQGCSPIGPRHRLTRAEGNLALTLDGRPALEVLAEDLSVFPQAGSGAPAQALHVALPVTGSDTGDYRVRNLIGVDPQRGAVVVGDRLDDVEQVMFCRRDAASAETELVRILGELKQALDGKPKGGVYFSCVARGPHLFGPESRELKIIRESLGPLPLAGFFGNGEISHDRLYGYTGVLTLFL